MKKIKLKQWVFLFLLILFLIFVFQNLVSVSVTIYFWTLVVPKAFLLGVTFLLGLLFGRYSSLRKLLP